MTKINKIINKIISVTAFSFFLFAVFSFSDAATDFKDAAGKIIDYSQKTINVIIGITMAFFFWGVAIMVMAGDNSAVKEKAKMRLGYGTIIIFVLFSIWGILAFVKNTTQLDNTKHDDIVDLSGLPDSL